MGLFGLLSTQEFDDKMMTLKTWLEKKMADYSNELNQVATTLRDRVFPGVQQLLAENVSLRQENASLKGEDVAESAASQEVIAATQEVSDLFAAPELPDVPPVTEPEAPADEPAAPADGG